jgi:hypothetical protein
MGYIKKHFWWFNIGIAYFLVVALVERHALLIV